MITVSLPFAVLLVVILPSRECGCRHDAETLNFSIVTELFAVFGVPCASSVRFQSCVFIFISAF